MYTLDRTLYAQPKEMRQSFLDTLHALPEHMTTVLIAMGYCGGSLDNICARQRLVIPNLDDCIIHRLLDGCHTNSIGRNR